MAFGCVLGARKVRLANPANCTFGTAICSGKAFVSMSSLEVVI